jgi:RimJ/RimL family protein N-acetyltransferase
VEHVVILRTNRLVVTTWAAEDLDDLHRLHSDPVTMTFIGGRVETRDESSARLTQQLAEQDTRGWTKWRVQTENGRMIGRGGFGRYDEDRELGYTIDRHQWGQGLATELASALVAWHVANPATAEPDGVQPMRLWGYADVDNVASIRVMTKAGLRFVETREQAGRPHAYFRLDDPATRSD